MLSRIFLIVASVFFFVATLPLSSHALAARVSGFDFQPGDILVTKNTRSAAFVGHAGIVDQSGKYFVSIAGPGHFPARYSIQWWLERYPSTKVVRYKSANAAKQAGAYAYQNYVIGKYKKQPYRITNNPKDRTYLYCSEIVWQSYYYGANTPYYNFATKPFKKVIPTIIAPYDYLNKTLQKLNGFSTVHSFNWP